MELLEAVILGVLQGIFEWLPVSSEGVNTLVMVQLFGKSAVDAIGVSVWLHLGTMLAALIYFREDFYRLTVNLPGYLSGLQDRKFSGDRDTNLTTFLIISTLASGLVGLLVYAVGLEAFSGSPELFTALIGLALFVTGAIKLTGKAGRRKLSGVDPLTSVFVGVLQGAAIIPGISRSGSTVFGLFYRDFSSEDAFKLSFLMSVPAIIVANIGLNLLEGFQVTGELLLASVIAFLVGYASIEAVLEIAERMEVAYLCFVLGALAFLPLLL